MPARTAKALLRLVLSVLCFQIALCALRAESPDAYLQAAQKGDPKAERILGDKYYWGNGVPQSDRDAFNWYYAAAVQGDPRAQEALGLFYRKGIFVAPDDREAFVWYQRSAEQNYTRAQAWLGYMYLHGRGVAKDFTAAASWFRKGAAQGDATGESFLGDMYLAGEGVPRNYHDAFAWYYSASVQDDSYAEAYLGKMYRDGLGVDVDNHAAFAWYYRSAILGNIDGEWGLAYMYYKGIGVEKNPAAALKWFKKAHHDHPGDRELAKITASLSLKAFLEYPDVSSLDTALMLDAYGQALRIISGVALVVYLATTAILLLLTFNASDTRPGIIAVAGWVLFYPGSQIAGVMAVFIFGKTLSIEKFLVIILVFSALPVILSSIGAYRKRGWKTSAGTWKSIFLQGAGALVAFYAVNFAYREAYTAITGSHFPLQPTIALVTKAKHTTVWLAYVTISLAAPAAEEIIFRGYFFDAMRRRFSGKVTIPVTAFFFSLIHFQLLYFVPLFAVGLVLGWARLKTGSLRLPFALHALNNGLSMLLLT